MGGAATAGHRDAVTARFPGIPAVADGSEAVAHVEMRVAEAAFAHAPSPATAAASRYEAAAADGRADLWGTPLCFGATESELSAATAAEGFALAGGRVTAFASGPGLALMKAELAVIAGKRLPAVFHAAARALTSQAQSVHAGHDDVMGVADTGWGILFARDVQEAADLAAIARRIAEKTETPFLVVQDGSLTTHTVENVLLPEDLLLREFLGAPRDRVRSYVEPADALMTGSIQNPDAFMKGKIGQRAFSHRLAEEVRLAMHAWTALTGRAYGLVHAYRCDDAETIVVAMGTIADTAIAVVDALRLADRRVGCVGVTSFRPFPAARLAAALRNARAIAVIERTDEPAAADNPLTREVKAALADLASDGARIPGVFSAVAGLGSRDVAAGDIAAVYRWLDEPATAGRRFAVLGVKHALGLERFPLEVRPRGAFTVRGHTVGGRGAATTSRLLAGIVGGELGLRVRASSRSAALDDRLPSAFLVSVGEERIRTHAEPEQVDLVALHDLAAFAARDPLRGIVDGGALLVETALADPQAIWTAIPADARMRILRQGIKVAAIDASELARRHAARPDLVARARSVALAGALLRLTPFGARSSLDGGGVDLAIMRAAYDAVVDVTAALAPETEGRRMEVFA